MFENCFRLYYVYLETYKAVEKLMKTDGFVVYEFLCFVGGGVQMLFDLMVALMFCVFWLFGRNSDAIESVAKS